MGVYHLAPVGTSPGAVTSALAYLKHNKDDCKFAVRGEIVEAVVVFPSWEVRTGTEGIPEECIFNDYGQENKRRSWKPRSAVLDIIRDFAKQEFGEEVLLFFCPVNADNYDDCFDRIAKVTLWFGAGVGKHLWANLTGGPNIVNAALFEVAFLSGLIARLYYTFLSDVRRYGRYLQPPSEDTTIFDWREVPLVKTAFDEDYYRVLKVLADYCDWMEDRDLLSLLAHEQPERFGSERMTLKVFLRDFLNKMDGRELEREVLPDGTPTNRNRLSLYGKMMVERISTSELFQILLHPGRREEDTINRLTADLQLEEL
jgi:hypothetical protein